jgi:hypothetical protein
MRILTTQENQIIERLVRRIDRNIAFEAHCRDDGEIELRLSIGRLKTSTQFGVGTLLGSGENAVEFEALRGKIKRVFDRMQVPPRPPKIPKVEIQKDTGYGFRSGNRGGRR